MLTVTSSWPAGQRNRPDPQRLWAEFEGIFEREYYTESGPRVRALEARLAALAGAPQAVCISNPAVAWAMLFEASGVAGQTVAIPAAAAACVLQGLNWAGCRIHWTSVDPLTPDLPMRRPSLQLQSSSFAGCAAQVGVHAWGGACPAPILEAGPASPGDPLTFFDASAALAVEHPQGPIGQLGGASVLALDATHLVDAAQGAVIFTADADLADRLRCMRSSGGVVRRLTVRRTVNGRMSEAQAAQAHVLLDDLPAILERNHRQFAVYESELSGLQGLTWLTGLGCRVSNHQQAVAHIADAAALIAVRQGLARQGCALPPVFCDVVEIPAARLARESLEAQLLILPLGQDLEEAAIAHLARQVRQAYTEALELSPA